MMRHLLCAAMGLALAGNALEAAENQVIRISTNHTDLVLQVAENGRLYQTYLGEKLLHESDLKELDWAVHAASDGSAREMRISSNRHWL